MVKMSLLRTVVTEYFFFSAWKRADLCHCIIHKMRTLILITNHGEFFKYQLSQFFKIPLCLTD